MKTENIPKSLLFLPNTALFSGKFSLEIIFYEPFEVSLVFSEELLKKSCLIIALLDLTQLITCSNSAKKQPFDK